MTQAEAFWIRLQKNIAVLAASKAHADVVIVIRDGAIQLVRVDQSFKPDQLPDPNLRPALKLT